jgi:dolichyldiphosphatase
VVAVTEKLKSRVWQFRQFGYRVRKIKNATSFDASTGCVCSVCCTEYMHRQRPTAAMGSLDPTAALPPFPQLKSFALTHILYDPAHPLSIPFTLLSLTPIFLFVSYFTLLIFDRRITILALAAGSILNEVLSLGLKRVLKGERPCIGYGEVGDGYGMPSSHSQAAGFLVAWGVGYWLTLRQRRLAGSHRAREQEKAKMVGRVRRSVYILGLITWSLLVAYSR